MVDDLTATFRTSIRRACGVYKFSRGTYKYKHRRTDRALLRKRIREIAKSRVCYGCKRIHIVLRREGWLVNHKRFHVSTASKLYSCTTKHQNVRSLLS